MYGSLTERITRSLAFMLRHQPEEFDLELDRHGFGDLEDVVCALNERLGEPIEAEDVSEAIEAGDRQRYEISDGKIRALYGHSFQVDPGESVEPPEELFVGVGSRDADRASRSGLHSGRRAFLHLARTFEEAREMGRRAAPEYAVITVHALDAWEDGIDFYDRISLFLSESIPTEFIEVGEVYDDGIRRESRGGRRGGGRGRGGPRRSRRDDDDRGRGRDSRRHREPVEEPEALVRDEPSPAPARDPEPARAKPDPAPPEPAPADEASEGFGEGVFGAQVEAAPQHEPDHEPEHELQHEAEAHSEPAEEAGAPEAHKPAEKETADGGGFGAGIL